MSPKRPFASKRRCWRADSELLESLVDATLAVNPLVTFNDLGNIALLELFKSRCPERFTALQAELDRCRPVQVPKAKSVSSNG